MAKTEFTEYCCEGGFDANDFTYIFPCEECMQRLAPATQDYTDYELKTFLDGIEFPEDHGLDLFDTDEQDLGTLIFGEQQAEHVFQEVMKEQKHGWPHVTPPIIEERVIEQHGVPRTFRFYKPFHRIQPEEEDDFKEFLNLIF
jgi:hypothetical protein